MKTKKLNIGVLLTASALLVACSKNSTENVPPETELFAGNIVGGVNSSDSFQKENGVVGLVIDTTDGQGICTGTLISRKLVLTAAHCLDSSGAQIRSIAVIFTQDVSKTSKEQVRYAVKGRVHNLFLTESMSGKGSWNDIALLKLNEDAPVDFKTARLPSADTLKSKTMLTQSGFGKAEAERNPASDTSGVLRQVSGIEVLGKSQDGKELLLKENGKGSCNGDSGGPAYVRASDGRLTQVGVNSRGTDPNSCIGVGIFTNVASHLQWIKVNSQALLAASN